MPMPRHNANIESDFTVCLARCQEAVLRHGSRIAVIPHIHT
jgi:hypothetical protein